MNLRSLSKHRFGGAVEAELTCFTIKIEVSLNRTVLNQVYRFSKKESCTYYSSQMGKVKGLDTSLYYGVLVWVRVMLNNVNSA